jgi:hypothetical protein
LLPAQRLEPAVEQSGERDRREPLPQERAQLPALDPDPAAGTAGRDPLDRSIVVRMRERHGRKRGSKVAAVETGRRLTEASWRMLAHGDAETSAPSSSARTCTLSYDDSDGP